MNIVPQLTTAGQSLLITALSGGSINFTKIVVGDGAAPSSQSSLTNLVNPLIEMAIEDFAKGDACVSVTGSLTNDDVSEGFYWKETGLFAEDGDGNEVLYAYCHTGDLYEYIPSNDSGKSVDIQLTVMVAVDDAENVTATISDNGTYASRADFNSHVNNTSNPHKVTLSQLGAGDAAVKSVDTTVSEESTNLPTSGAVYTAIVNALKGIDTSDLLSKTSGGTVAAALTITGLLTASGGIAFTDTSTFAINDKGYLVLSLGEGLKIDNDVELTSGTIVLYRDPTSNMEAVTKQYVDNSLKGKADSSHTHSLWDTTFEIIFTCYLWSDYENWAPGGDEGNTNVQCLLFTLDTAIRPASLEAAIENSSNFTIKNLAVNYIKQVTLDDETTMPDYVSTDYFVYSAEMVIFSYNDVVKYVGFNSWKSKNGDISVDTGDTETHTFSMSALKQTMLL